jgi:magnesium transporter
VIPVGRRLFKKRSKKIGLPPGTVHIVDDGIKRETLIEKVKYSDGKYEESSLKSIDDLIPTVDDGCVHWININGIYDKEIIEKLGKMFSIHPLILEDIASTDDRPKFQDLDEYIFVIMKQMAIDSKDDELKVNQISLLLFPNLVISFQEGEANFFQVIKSRISQNVGRIRKMGADYLLYSLMDFIVDNYFLIFEILEDRIDNLEERLISNPSREILFDIERIKRDMIQIRKAIWPFRDVVNKLLMRDIKVIEASLNIYLRDVYDHVIQVIDMI